MSNQPGNVNVGGPALPGQSSAPSNTTPRRASIAFLNCKNLFDVKACKRAPQNDPALTEKTKRLAELLKGLTFSEPPAFICLCEVGSPNLGIGVTQLAFPATTYQTLWSHDGTPDKDETGLLIFYDVNLVTANRVFWRDRPLRNKGQRSRWLAGRFSLSGAASELGIVINHWSSGIHSETDGVYQRRRIADEVADLFRGAATLRLGPGPRIFEPEGDVILVGDFNCDPFDPIFRLTDKGAWSASHSRAAVEAATKGSLPCFFNPLLKAPEIDGTFSAGLKSRMLDYLLFSRSFLLGRNAFRYVDGSIRISGYDPLASDHLAVGASFDIL